MLKFKNMMLIFLVLLVCTIPQVSAESNSLNHSIVDCEFPVDTVANSSCDIHLDDGLLYGELEQEVNETISNTSNNTVDITVDMNSSSNCAGLNGGIISDSNGVNEYFTLSNSGISGIFNLNTGSTLILSHLNFVTENLGINFENNGGLLFGDNIFFINTIVNLQKGDIFIDISLINGNIHFVGNYTSHNSSIEIQNESAVNSEDNGCTTGFYNLFNDFDRKIILSGNNMIFQFNIADLGNTIFNFINIKNSAIDFIGNITAETEEFTILSDFSPSGESKNITLEPITLNPDKGIVDNAIKSSEIFYNDYVSILSSFDVNIKDSIAGVYGGALYLIYEAFIDNVDL